ncbi:MAG: RodZ domain-containing protein [Candidatus Omnitrophota bacterium]
MSIGLKLKTARESKGVAPEQVYAHTKIHADLIRALEQDKYERISNPTYIKSFLKKYASYLGLDEREILDEYSKLPARKAQQEIPGVKIADNASARRKEEKQPAQKFLSLKIIILGIACIMFLVLTVVAIRGAIGLAKSQSKNIAAGIRSMQAKSQAKPQVAESSKQQDYSSRPFIVPKNVELTLTIKAQDDVWIRLQADEKIIFVGTLKKGSSETWGAKDSYMLWAGKAHQLRLNLNGNDLGTAGNGVIKSVVIDRRGIKK